MSGFYDRIKEKRGDNDELVTCIERTVEKLATMKTGYEQPGMLLGKVQSGKTRAFMGIIALAFDREFEAAVILTKGTNTLAKQTLNRVQEEFADFMEEDELEAFDILTMPQLNGWELKKKLVFVVKKQKDNLRRLLDAFVKDYPVLSKRRVLLIDDEADFASISFRKDHDTDCIEQGILSGQIDEFRRSVLQCSFLQVTATPYSLYLQPTAYDIPDSADWGFLAKRPAFTELVPIHNAYVGGDHFFGNHEDNSPLAYLWSPVEDEELEALLSKDGRVIRTDRVLTTNKIKALRNCLMNFFVGAFIRREVDAINKIKPKKYSLIIHIEVARAGHTWQESIIREVLLQLKNNHEKIDDLFADAWEDISKSVDYSGMTRPEKTKVLKLVKEALTNDYITINKVNSDGEVKAMLNNDGQLNLRAPLNIFIGGQILDRGITISQVIGFYYGRSPKKLQQDTVLQHCRMYGARPHDDLAVTRFYTSHRNFNCMKRINEFDSALREAFIRGGNDAGIVFMESDSAKEIRPCSPNKVLASDVVTLGPGGRMLPYGFFSKSKTKIKSIIDEIDIFTKGHDAPFEVTKEKALSLLNSIEMASEDCSDAEMPFVAMRAAIQYFAEHPVTEGKKNLVLIYPVRDRKLKRKRDSGRLADNPDTKQHREVVTQYGQTLPVLMILRQEGAKEQKWGGLYPFWWPVLFSPVRTRPLVFAREV